MTLDQIVNFCCAKVGQLDAYSTGLCAGFVNRRYQMIYDSENWQDTLLGFFVPIVPGNGTVIQPPTIERVISVQLVGGDLLLPVDFKFILETNPTFITAPFNGGIPKYYTTFAETGVSQIQIFPSPDKNYQIYVYGKKVFTELTGPDTPIIRNISNCLIAFAIGDMLQRQRQYAKAQQMVEEAGNLLELMRKVEQQNSNQPRKSKSLTIAGDSLAEMTDAVSCRVGDYSPASRILIQEYLRRNYLDVYDSQAWLESMVIAQITRDGAEVILPEYFERVQSVRANSQLAELVPADQSLYFGIAPQIFEQTGSPVAFSTLTSVGVATLPPSTEQMVFVSSDPDDKSPVFIMGESGGVELSEAIPLNGTTPVKTANQWDTPLTIAKGITQGDVTVTSFLSNTLLVTLLAGERERKHVRIWLVPTPAAQDGTVCLIMGKRRIKPLVTDEDTPLLRGMGNALISLTVGDFFTQSGNAAGATAAQTKGAAALASLIDRETNQTAYAPRIVPYTEFTPSGLGEWDDHQFWHIAK